MNMVLPETLVSAVGEFGQQSSDGRGDFIYHHKRDQGTSGHFTGAVDRRATTSEETKSQDHLILISTSVPLYMLMCYLAPAGTSELGETEVPPYSKCFFFLKYFPYSNDCMCVLVLAL